MPTPQAIAPSGGNLLLGRGKIYMAILTLTNGVYVRGGEFDIGNCTEFVIEPSAEVKEKYESMDPASSLYARAVTRETFKVKITGDEFTLFNLANVLMGSQGTINVTGATVSGSPGETLATNPVGGAWYSFANRQISAVTVKLGATTLVANTDYILDTVRGRIYIVPGGAGAGVGSLTAGYTYSTYTFNTVQLGKVAGINAFVRFVGNPSAGPTYEGEFWNVQFTPSGSLGFITDDFGNWTLEGMVIADLSGHPNEPNGRLIQTA